MPDVPAAEATAKTVGIDLGTTCSCVAIAEPSEPPNTRLLANKMGQTTIPSMVATTAAGKLLVGHPAKRQALTNPQNTLYGVKRLIGRHFHAAEVQRALAQVSYRAQAGVADGIDLLMGETRLSPIEVSAQVLQQLRQIAEMHLKVPVNQAVVAVPAYFDAAQRQATITAAQLAGFQHTQLLDEPIATALAYGTSLQQARHVAVYDLGGGAFDVSVLKKDTAPGHCSLLASAGDAFLGGENFDARLVEQFDAQFAQTHALHLKTNSMALQRLREAAEKARIELSSATSCAIDLPFILPAAQQDGKTVNFHVQTNLSRAVFESMMDDLVQRTLALCAQAVAAAGLQTSDIDCVVLVGGMTRTPLVKNIVEKFFGMPALSMDLIDEPVACGAALYGSRL